MIFIIRSHEGCFPHKHFGFDVFLTFLGFFLATFVLLSSFLLFTLQIHEPSRSNTRVAFRYIYHLRPDSLFFV